MGVDGRIVITSWQHDARRKDADLIELCPQFCHEQGFKDSELVCIEFEDQPPASGSLRRWCRIRHRESMPRSYFGASTAPSRSAALYTAEDIAEQLHLSAGWGSEMQVATRLVQAISPKEIPVALQVHLSPICSSSSSSAHNETVSEILSAMSMAVKAQLLAGTVVYTGRRLLIDFLNWPLWFTVSQIKCARLTPADQVGVILFPGSEVYFEDTPTKASSNSSSIAPAAHAARAATNLADFYCEQTDVLDKHARKGPVIFAVEGPAGVGKTSFASYFLHTRGYTRIRTCHGHELVRPGPLSNTFSHLDQLFAPPAALMGSPYGIVLDHIEEIGRPEDRGPLYMYLSRLLAEFRAATTASAHSHHRCVLILVKSRDQLPGFLTSSSASADGGCYLDACISLSAPTQPVRLRALQHFASRVPVDRAVLETLSLITHGFFVSDLYRLVLETVSSLPAGYTPLSGECEHQDRLVLEDFVRAKSTVAPSALSEYLERIDWVPLSSVYGLDAQIAMIQRAVLAPLRHQALASSYNIGLSRGLLLHGPSGMGKTLLAKAIAYESGLNLLSVGSASIRSKVVGESEKALARVFTAAREAAPSILLFEDIDMLAGSRTARFGNPGSSSDSSGGGSGDDRLLSTLLTLMDGVHTNNGGPEILVIATTARLERVDNALLRPGRIDTSIHVAPSCVDDVRGFISKLAETHYPCLFSKTFVHDVLHNKLCSKSYAEIDAVFRNAALNALRRNVGADQIAEEDMASVCG